MQVLQERRQAAEGKVEWESEERGKKVISTIVVKVVLILVRWRWSSRMDIDGAIKVNF